MSHIDADELEIAHGTAILSALTGQELIRNQQPVRLFDQTRHTAELYFKGDERGKPYIQDFQQGKRFYPITAYCHYFKIDYATALAHLSQQYCLDNNRSFKTVPLQAIQNIVKPLSIDYLPINVYQRSQSLFKQNGFYCYLREHFDDATASQLFEQYRLGTSRRWSYQNSLATAFPQFDKDENLRQIKVIPFHPYTGRRAKKKERAHKWNASTNQYELDESEKVWFAGRSMTRRKNAHLKQCYFGEHLLTLNPYKTVALVEGESTAIVCSAIWSDYIWLATGGSNGCKWYAPDVFTVLRDRNVVLWPDTGKYQEWQEKTKPLHQVTHKLKISRYVEDNAPTEASNIDLRDLLTWPCYTPKNGVPVFGEVLSVNTYEEYPIDWDRPI